MCSWLEGESFKTRHAPSQVRHPPETGTSNPLSQSQNRHRCCHDFGDILDLRLQILIRETHCGESGSAIVTMPLRRARIHDLGTISVMFADAFWSERVMGELMHPHRATYPEDYRRFWKRSVIEWYWDYSHQLVVIYVTKPTGDGKEKNILVGVADWERYGKGWERYWGLWGSWDLRKLTFSCLTSFAGLLFGTRHDLDESICIR